MELGGKSARPAAIAPRMDLHRDPLAALVQLQDAGPAGYAKVPVAASLAASQFTLASDHKTASFALLEDLLGAEVDAQFQHCATVGHPRVGELTEQSRLTTSMARAPRITGLRPTESDHDPVNRSARSNAIASTANTSVRASAEKPHLAA